MIDTVIYWMQIQSHSLLEHDNWNIFLELMLQKLKSCWLVKYLNETLIRLDIDISRNERNLQL